MANLTGPKKDPGPFSASWVEPECVGKARLAMYTSACRTGLISMRSPQVITAGIAALDAESAEVLENIKALL